PIDSPSSSATRSAGTNAAPASATTAAISTTRMPTDSTISSERRILLDGATMRMVNKKKQIETTYLLIDAPPSGCGLSCHYHNYHPRVWLSVLAAHFFARLVGLSFCARGAQ